MSLPTLKGRLIPSSPQEIPSSPPQIRSDAARFRSPQPPSTRERRNPSVTPRKFRKFFTPRSYGPATRASTRNALHDITTNNVHQSQSSPIRAPRSLNELSNEPPSSPPVPRDLKRRKLFHTTPSTSPINASPRENCPGFEFMENIKPKDNNSLKVDSSWSQMASAVVEPIVQSTPKVLVKRINTVDNRGLASQLLHMNIGSSSTGRTQRFVPYVNGTLPSSHLGDHTYKF